MDLDSSRLQRRFFCRLFQQGAMEMLRFEKWWEKKNVVCGLGLIRIVGIGNKLYFREADDESGHGFNLFNVFFREIMSRLGRHKVKKMKIRISWKGLLPAAAIQPQTSLSWNYLKIATIFTLLVDTCALHLPSPTTHTLKTKSLNIIALFPQFPPQFF